MADKLDMRVLSGESVKSYLDIISNLKSPEAEKDVKGFSAQKGIKTGRVRVISSINDVGIFKNGEVLIAKTTHPNYLSAMSKAVAIVTDEGGIASHAAITARELKIPCIVGTKIATRVLKDGDLVEVDAERGIVRILKKNNE
jgi:pyruvate,water dikinase